MNIETFVKDPIEVAQSSYFFPDELSRKEEII